MNDFSKGIGYVREGLQLIRQPGLRRYVAMPLLISIIVFSAGIFFGLQWLTLLLDWLLDFLPGWLDWLRFVLWPLFALLGVLVIFYSFALITNLIAAPFNGLLAEAVERHLTHQSLDEVNGWKTVLQDLIPSLLSELRKLLYFVLRAIPLGILFLIPLINLTAPFLWALFSAWMLAVEYLDFPMGNHRLRFDEQRRLLKQRRLLSYGFGGTSLLMTMIPVLNFLAIPASVAGATAMWVREFSNSQTDIPSSQQH